MGIEAKIGDVFLIPLDDTSCVGGQVISIRDENEFYLAVFGQRLSMDETDPEIATSGSPRLLGLSFDAKLWHGHWPIIGNLIEKVGAYPQPNYKVRRAGVLSFQSRDATVTRPITDEEAKLLEYRTVCDAAVIEDAIKAICGIGEWSEHYDNLRAEYAIASSKLL